MDGIHDMGGMHGFGPVPTTEDTSFHHEWERTVFGIDRVLKAMGIYNIDEKRHAIERLDPQTYVTSGYFERWLYALETLLQENTDVTIEETNPTTESPDFDSQTEEEILSNVRDSLYSTSRFDHPPKPPKYHEGETVKVANHAPSGHTRCPRYIRRATGTISDHRGTFTYPDDNAHGKSTAQPLYSVAFDANQLWEHTNQQTHTIYLDLWEPYLEYP
jgi:nitrile hydratase